MAQDPAPTPEKETGVDVFEHEMADLERSVWKENRIHPLIVIAGAVVIALCLGAGFFLLSSTFKRGERGTSTIMAIDVKEPRSGRLALKPVRFEWESTASTRAYMVTIRERDALTDLIIRESPTNSIQLTDEEAARLVKGGRYTWQVRARSDRGWTIGEGGGAFSF